MPLPAARFALPYVGGTRDQGSHPGTRTDPQVGRLLRCGQPRYGQVRAGHVPGIQWRDVPSLSENTPTPSLPGQTHDHRARQRQVPPRQTFGTFSARVSPRPISSIPAAVQPPARAHRARMETHPAIGNAQSVFRHTTGGARSRQRVLRQMATTQLGPAQTMLHYLSRYV